MPKPPVALAPENTTETLESVVNALTRVGGKGGAVDQYEAYARAANMAIGDIAKVIARVIDSADLPPCGLVMVPDPQYTQQKAQRKQEHLASLGPLSRMSYRLANWVAGPDITHHPNTRATQLYLLGFLFMDRRRRQFSGLALCDTGKLWLVSGATLSNRLPNLLGQKFLPVHLANPYMTIDNSNGSAHTWIPDDHPEIDAGAVLRGLASLLGHIEQSLVHTVSDHASLGLAPISDLAPESDRERNWRQAVAEVNAIAPGPEPLLDPAPEPLPPKATGLLSLPQAPIAEELRLAPTPRR